MNQSLFMTHQHSFLLNGSVIKPEDPAVIQDYNSDINKNGLVETMRFTDGRIRFLNEHLSRLREGLVVKKLKEPADIKVEKFMRQITKLISENELHGDIKIRLMVFEDSKATTDGQLRESSYLVETIQLEDHDYSWSTNGLSIGVFKDAYKQITSASMFKNINLNLTNEAQKYAGLNKWDESIILNEDGQVIETAISNLFIVIHNDARSNRIVLTPPVDDGCVRGILRGHVIKLMHLYGIKFQEKSLHLEDLENASEIFLTNAVRGIRWVSTFNDMTFNHDISSTLHQHLIKKANST